MAQADQGRGGLARFTFRTIATIVGLIGSVIALVLVLLYSLFDLLGTIAGVATDDTHLFAGLFLVLIGAVGSFMAPVLPIVAAVALAIAGIGLFFTIGWWALIASPFLLVAALMTFSNKRVNVPGTA
jgi:hypothetical protein